MTLPARTCRSRRTPAIRFCRGRCAWLADVSLAEFWLRLVLMHDGERVWRPMRGEEPIADLVVTGSDFPWLNARVRTLPGFEQVRPLFEEELRALEHIDDDHGAWQSRLRQHSQGGQPDVSGR